MLKLLDSKHMHNFQPHLTYVVATLSEKNWLQKKNDSVCFVFPLKSVSGSEKLDRLYHDGTQQKSIANVQNDGQL